jgi:hypothetical protein
MSRDVTAGFARNRTKRAETQAAVPLPQRESSPMLGCHLANDSRDVSSASPASSRGRCAVLFPSNAAAILAAD